MSRKKISADSPFAALREVKIAPRKKPMPQPPAEPEPAAPPSEEELFSLAMSGVDPLAQGGRKVPPPPPASAPPDLGAGERDACRALEQLVNGELEFELECTEEFVQGHVRGLDLKIVRQLKAGVLSTEAHLDLHGLNAQQAYDSLLFFLRESYLQGRRAVLLVTGRGKGSPLGMGILKQEVQRWLTREPLRRVVLAFATAQPRHGGAGALYVLLRRQKKTVGKVAWQRDYLFGEDLP